MDAAILKIKEELLEKVKQAVIDGNDVIVGKYVLDVLNSKIPNPFESVMTVLIEGIKRVADMYETGDCELPDVILAGEALKEALSILTNNTNRDSYFPQAKKGKVILGTVEGDTHDIGKNVVAALLRANDFEVFDLGQNVPPQVFVKKAIEHNANIIGASAFMSSTRSAQKRIVADLKKAKIRDKVIFIIGGAAVSKAYANSIGADGYAKDAFETIDMLEELLNYQKQPDRPTDNNHKQILLKMDENRKMIQQLAEQVKQFQEFVGVVNNIENNTKSHQWGLQESITSDKIMFSEEKIYNILSSLSNKVRLKILKVLWQESLQFSDIEEKIEVKGGHLQFHIGKLKDEGLVTQEKNRGKYLISKKGRKIIAIINQIASLTEEHN
ncbi:MAG: cobalamin-dependent protein [Promethearchaeota archaeon]